MYSLWCPTTQRAHVCGYELHNHLAQNHLQQISHANGKTIHYMVFTRAEVTVLQNDISQEVSQISTWNQIQKVIEHSHMLLVWPRNMRKWRQPIIRTTSLHMTFLLTCRTDNSWTLHNAHFCFVYSTSGTINKLSMFQEKLQTDSATSKPYIPEIIAKCLGLQQLVHSLEMHGLQKCENCRTLVCGC